MVKRAAKGKAGKKKKKAGQQASTQPQAPAADLGVQQQPQKKKLSRKQKRHARKAALQTMQDQAEPGPSPKAPRREPAAPPALSNLLPYRPPHTQSRESSQANGRLQSGTSSAEQRKPRRGWGGSAPGGRLQLLPPPQTPLDLLSPADSRPILLFDLNGTLTSHTSIRRSSGINSMRPGTQHLRKLSGHFRLGIFSSASPKTVATVLPMLEEAAGVGERLFADDSLVLSRGHTREASKEHKAGGGKDWDTVKPLGKWFARLHRVLLVDDDAYKACPGEERNMVRVPCWDGSLSDRCLEIFARVLLRALDGMDEGTDVREYSGAVSDSVAAELLGDRLATAAAVK